MKRVPTQFGPLTTDMPVDVVPESTVDLYHPTWPDVNGNGGTTTIKGSTTEETRKK